MKYLRKNNAQSRRVPEEFFSKVNEGSFLKNLYDPFSWMAFKGLKATEPRRWDSLLLTVKSPGDSGTPLIVLGMMKGWVDLGATQWF